MPPNSLTSYPRIAAGNAANATVVSPPGRMVSYEEYASMVEKYENEKKEKNDLIATTQNAHRNVPVDNAMKGEIERYVKSCVFSDIKFIRSIEELEDMTSEHSFAKRILDQFRISISRQAGYWKTYKNIAKQALNARKANVQTTIQEEIIMMFAKTDYENGLLDDIDETMKKKWNRNQDTRVYQGKCIGCVTNKRCNIHLHLFFFI